MKLKFWMFVVLGVLATLLISVVLFTVKTILLGFVIAVMAYLGYLVWKVVKRVDDWAQGRKIRKN